MSWNQKENIAKRYDSVFSDESFCAGTKMSLCMDEIRQVN